MTPGYEPARSELALAAALLVGIVATELVALHGGVLLTQPLWLDEFHTLFLSGRQTMLESLSSLAAGADFNPPGLFLLYRVVGFFSRGLSELSMRATSLATVCLACFGVYGILRTRFDRTPAFLGALAVWAHPLVAAESFDARFYGPWLLYAVLFVASVDAISKARSFMMRVIAPLVSAVLLCTIHYFGIVSWAAITCAAFCISDRSVLDRLRMLAPLIAGPIALVCCLPFYVGQRQALSIPTWLWPPTGRDIVLLFAYVLVTPTLAVSLVCSRVSLDLARLRSLPVPSRSLHSLSGGPALLLSLAVIPPVMIAFTWLVQPVNAARYWIAGVLAIPPIVAWAASYVGRAALIFIYVVTLAASVVTLRGLVEAANRRIADDENDLRSVRRFATDSDLIVAHRRSSLYPLLRAAPDLANRAYVLDAVGLDLDARMSEVERDISQVHRRLYGLPQVIEPVDLNARRSFLMLEPLDEGDTLVTGAFPGFSAESLAPRLKRYNRSSTVAGRTP